MFHIHSFSIQFSGGHSQCGKWSTRGNNWGSAVEDMTHGITWVAPKCNSVINLSCCHWLPRDSPHDSRRVTSARTTRGLSLRPWRHCRGVRSVQVHSMWINTTWISQTRRSRKHWNNQQPHSQGSTAAFFPVNLSFLFPIHGSDIMPDFQVWNYHSWFPLLSDQKNSISLNEHMSLEESSSKGLFSKQRWYNREKCERSQGSSKEEFKTQCLLSIFYTLKSRRRGPPLTPYFAYIIFLSFFNWWIFLLMWLHRKPILLGSKMAMSSPFALTVSHHSFLLVSGMLLFGFLKTTGADFVSASVTVPLALIGQHLALMTSYIVIHCYHISYIIERDVLW